MPSQERIDRAGFIHEVRRLVYHDKAAAKREGLGDGCDECSELQHVEEYLELMLSECPECKEKKVEHDHMGRVGVKLCLNCGYHT